MSNPDCPSDDPVPVPEGVRWIVLGLRRLQPIESFRVPRSCPVDGVSWPAVEIDHGETGEMRLKGLEKCTDVTRNEGRYLGRQQPDGEQREFCAAAIDRIHKLRAAGQRAAQNPYLNKEQR